MAIANGTILKVAQEINLPDSVVAMNIYYFDCDFQDSQDEATCLSNLRGWVEDLYDSLISAVSEGVSMGSMKLYAYNTITDQWDNKGSRTPEVAFATVAEMLPHGVALMVRAYTVKPRTIGRKYVAGLTTAAIEDGTWVSAILAVGVAYGVLWSTVAEIDGNNILRPSVFNTILKSAEQLTGTEVVLADPAYQRRRRPGVGM